MTTTSKTHWLSRHPILRETVPKHVKMIFRGFFSPFPLKSTHRPPGRGVPNFYPHPAPRAQHGAVHIAPPRGGPEDKKQDVFRKYPNLKNANLIITPHI